MRTNTAIAALGLAMLALALGCKQAEPRKTSQSLSSKLTDSLLFPNSTKLDGFVPDSTANDVALLALGPTVRVVPGALGLMALEVQDPQQRPIAATLMQFSDAEQHLRVPVEEGGGSASSRTSSAPSRICAPDCATPSSP